MKIEGRFFLRGAREQGEKDIGVYHYDLNPVNEKQIKIAHSTNRTWREKN